MQPWTTVSWLLLALWLSGPSAAGAHRPDEDHPEAAHSDESEPRPHLNWRPMLSISDQLIPIKLIESPEAGGPGRAPGRKQLRKPALLALLGRDLDPRRVSVERPAALLEGPEEDREAGTDPELKATLRSLNASGGPEAEAWMLRRAACPMRYVWEDVGALFWPRWVKRGECVNEPRRSCSWPPGMLCVPGESRLVHLLRWHCRPRSRRSTMAPGTGSGRHQERPGESKHYRCQWLKVPYPVTDKCSCSC